MHFVCSECKTELVLPEASQVVSGPCPKCGTWIDASEFAPQKDPDPQVGSSLPAKSDPKRRRGVSVSGKGRVRADGYLDHEFNERKELHTTIKILAVTLAVLAVILFITMYLKEWMTQ